MSLLEYAHMPLDAAGNIEYLNALEPRGKRFQANPPVCTSCKREITRENIGRAYWLREERTRSQYEVIECTRCTNIKDGGVPLQVFLQRHNL
jgi:hypothetical protein